MKWESKSRRVYLSVGNGKIYALHVQLWRLTVTIDKRRKK